MSSGIAGLHKILKDENRRKIILLLNEKDRLTYTELLESTQIGSTGLLNYHLKVLGVLLVKNEAGQYQLSEKGKLAFKLITEFPEENNQAQRRRNQKLIITGAIIGHIVYLSAILSSYFTEQLSFPQFVSALIPVISSAIMMPIIYRMQRNIPTPGSNAYASRMKVAYVSGGIVLFLITAFFAVGIVFRVTSDLLGTRFSTGNPLYETFWSTPYLVFSLLIAPAIGAVVFYYWGKKNAFQRPKWAIWISNHF
jgi:Na+/H+-translocating membrane pyrophosphatase